MIKRHRVFIAINFPPEIKKVLSRYEENFKELPAKWVEQENLHITLAFLGSITDKDIGEACIVAKSLADNKDGFKLNLESVEYGPTNKMPYKMVWLRGQKSKELSSLKNQLDQELVQAINFKPDHKGFSPHITLARINQMQLRVMDSEEIPEINEKLDLNFEVESIDVMESVLTKNGPAYTIIESFSLKLRDYE